MNGLPEMTVLSLAAIFMAIGLVQLAGPRFVRNAYDHWDYPQGIRLVTGLADIAAAVMLAQPGSRGWGIALAALLTFGSVVTLLNHRHYAFASAGVLMMIALVPAALALPLKDQVRFINKPQRIATAIESPGYSGDCFPASIRAPTSAVITGC